MLSCIMLCLHTIFFVIVFISAEIKILKAANRIDSVNNQTDKRKENKKIRGGSFWPDNYLFRFFIAIKHI